MRQNKSRIRDLKLNPRVLADYDTVVECKKCGKRQYLFFVNGLKNGWDKCCGYTMPIIYCIANIEEAVKSLPITMEANP